MSKLLIVSGSVPASINTNLAYAHKLKLAGHDIVCASPADIKGLVENRGLPFFKLGGYSAHLPIKANNSDFPSLTKKKKLEHLCDLVDDHLFESLVAQFDPDLVLIDFELHTLTMKAVTMGLNVVLLSPLFTLWKFPNIPPLHNVAIPGQGWRGSRLMIDLLWRKFWLTLRKRRLMAARKNNGIDKVAVLRAYAERIGFPFETEAETMMWQLPISFKSLPMISTTLAEMDLPHKQKPHFHYAGPIIHLGRSEPSMMSQEQDEIDAFLKTRDKRKPLIYASISSIFEPDLPFLKKLVQASGGSDWDMILSLGKKLQVEELAPLPENIKAFNWVPQLKIIEQADCVITHAGINTINECLWFGVPMLVYSGNNIDQNGCGARIAYHNLGLVGSKSADSSEDIRANIDQVLVNPEIARSIQEMSQIARQFDVDNTAVRLVESYLPAEEASISVLEHTQQM